jgi:ABC-type lipoprotein export system ATPase subunit
MSEKKTSIELRDVAKHYKKGGEVVKAVDGINQKIPTTGMVAIVGPSGSGKSTLLHMIGAMDRPTRVEVMVAGKVLNGLPEKDLTRFRRASVGFVFQTFNLIPNLTALENVSLPMEFNHVPKGERLRRAKALLERLGLGRRFKHRPNELSGGEMQRVAIARALANDPPLVLADEPTGNLDSQTGQMIYDLLKEIGKERTVVVVTHAEALAQMADKVLHIRDGKFQDHQ